ncbi:hypothetical protein [Rhizobium terrae]|uniref:hypothetical protein n=1 Tax=Rhizobium terrae TaxID=2171756 RepID=UPI000E3B7CE4|nr:hypothetical protein [Rhizobium terrae]
MKGLKFRLSKKLLFIMMGSVVVLGGGSGAAAVFIGTDKILGPSYLEINGLECTAVDTVKIKRDQRYWVRRYVVSDEPGDGMARIRTALRVAKAVQEKEKADLVQVAMLDKAGPKDRAQMRGRTIGAQVVYIPDPKKAPEGTAVQPFSAYYLDGAANSNGEYYGMRIDLPLEDIEALTARLTDKADCADPVVAAPAGEHGAPAAGHGEKAKGGGDHGKPSGGHGEASGGHGEPSGHDAAPAAEGHGAPAEGHGDEVAAKESGGFLSSITGMIFGSKTEEAPAEGHAGEGEAQAAAPAGHDAPAGDPGKAVAEGHGDKKPASSKQAAGAEHGVDKPTSAKQAANDHGAKPAPAKEQAAAAELKKEEGGFLASLTGMIFGSGETEKPAASQEAAQPAPKTAKATEPAPEPRTSAEGGKRWSKQTEADAVRSDGGKAEAARAEPAPAPADGSTDADAAGAAWLAKLRGEAPAAAAPAPAAPAKSAKPDQEASAKPAKIVH